jgi:hypothetical protein
LLRTLDLGKHHRNQGASRRRRMEEGLPRVQTIQVQGSSTPGKVQCPTALPRLCQYVLCTLESISPCAVVILSSTLRKGPRSPENSHQRQQRFLRCLSRAQFSYSVRSVQAFHCICFSQGRICGASPICSVRAPNVLAFCTASILRSPVSPARVGFWPNAMSFCSRADIAFLIGHTTCDRALAEISSRICLSSAGY